MESLHFTQEPSQFIENSRIILASATRGANKRANLRKGPQIPRRAKLKGPQTGENQPGYFSRRRRKEEEERRKKQSEEQAGRDGSWWSRRW